MKIIKGNLLTAFDDGHHAIMHQANCLKTFGSGVALAIKNKWPAAYQADLDWPAPPDERLAHITFADVEGGTVYNIYAQRYYSNREIRNTNYEALYNGLEKVRDEMTKRGQSKLACPYKMSSALAGGHWPIVAAMIDKVFENIEVTAYEIVF